MTLSAEALKAALREYANEHHPGWAVAQASFRIGEIGEHFEETLVIVQDRDQTTSAPSAPATRGS